MISIKSDPAHPRGGYAEVSLPEADLPQETTEVAVFDNYSERFLGEAGWQPTKVLFGPYEVRHAGGQARVVIGPEIVNQIEEYANVKLYVGPHEQDISWPDDVVPAPGAARIGGIMGAAAPTVAAKSTLSAKIPEAVAEVAEAPAEQEPVKAPVLETQPAERKSGKGGMIAGLAGMVLLAAGIAYWLLSPEQVPVEPIVTPAPVAEPLDPCGIERLAALGDFAAQAAALRDCAGQASADAALGLVERATAAGDAGALLLFGIIYDGSENDAIIEDQIGLTFGDAPATAAEYYARAVAAGSEQAVDRLAALCTRMEAMTETLVQSAVADYCSN